MYEPYRNEHSKEKSWAKEYRHVPFLGSVRTDEVGPNGEAVSFGSGYRRRVKVLEIRDF